MDDPGVGREGGHVAGDAVVESHPQGDQQVGRLDRLVDVLPAVHADEAQAERVRLVHGADAEQRVRHRDLGLLGQLAQLFGGVGDQDAVAGQDDRAL